jgi:hypothetical protein
MKCTEIFKGALRPLNEKGAVDENQDYAERAPYILSAMFSECSNTDKKYRAANGLTKQGSFNSIYTDLTADFPLCSRFNGAAIFYLASLLIIDENDDLSDSFYDKYCDSISSIVAETSASPAVIEQTLNVY